MPLFNRIEVYLSPDDPVVVGVERSTVSQYAFRLTIGQGSDSVAMHFDHLILLDEVVSAIIQAIQPFLSAPSDQ